MRKGPEMSFDLVKMRRVDLKSLVAEKDFIPWLLEAGNLDVLQDTVGFKMNVHMLDNSKDPSFPDVMAKKQDAPNQGTWVLLESQYDLTDNDFMARLFNYAAFLKPSNIIWISERFTNEHRAIMDWLNGFGSHIQFFALEVELWGIGKEIACKFNIVSRPQKWIAPKIEKPKNIKIQRIGSKKLGKPPEERDEDGLTKTSALYFKFWIECHKYLKLQDGPFHMNTPVAKPFNAVSVGKTGISLKSMVSLRKNRISVELNFWAEFVQPYFYIMKLEEAQIHDELGYPLEWVNNEEKVGSMVSIFKEDVNIRDESEWQPSFIWLNEKILDFVKILRPRLRNINPDDWLNKIES